MAALQHQQHLDDDMLIDPRMALPLYGIKAGDKDTASDSPGQFMMTPRMFASDNEDALDNPPDFMLQDADGDTGTIEVAPPHIISPPETVSHSTPPSEEAQSEAATQPSKKSSISSSTETPATRASKRKRTRTGTAANNSGGNNNNNGNSSSSKKRAAQQPAAASASAAPTPGASAASKRGSEPRGTDAKRTHCLERNRIAASKCREKKKQWVHDLEARKSELEAQHAGLHAELASLADEVTTIKNYLMGHASCGDANIDLWIENEALRFVHRSVSGQDQPQHLDIDGSRHSSIGSLPSTMHSRNGLTQAVATDSIGQASIAQTDNSSLASPVLKTEPINYDYMPEEMFQDAS
ncbi:bZIP transcription factor domain-containing protein [Purpureocillium lavendulum]|uniref:BZIP transcription factor domain-containing protein n=1 Tax=Purpureocillium lavendulum TaxID=1247861 RepID=A0AB34FNE5_9HYPO|nr:bZIP transcription factor domain-containing protein [Purpureocillium lavendulum]